MPIRDNGLTAANYSPLVELDPPLIEQVLDLLAHSGIAAFVEPVEGQRGPYQDVQLPDRVVVQLQVDRERVDDARIAVAAQVPALRAAFLADSAARDDRSAMAAAEVDAAWARIVAGYDGPTNPVGPWSAAEDVDGSVTPTSGGSGLSERLVRRSDSEPSVTWDDGWENADDPDNHYVPPPPPPLPQVDGVTRLAWLGILGGPLFILITSILGLQMESWVVFLALLAFCGGIATLVARMGDHPSQDDGWDDGAVV